MSRDEFSSIVDNPRCEAAVDGRAAGPGSTRFYQAIALRAYEKYLARSCVHGEMRMTG